MHDRQRLLVYTTLILSIVAAAGVGITGLQFHLAAAAQEQLQNPGSEPPVERASPYATAVWLAVAQTLVVVAGGGTLLLRVIHPFTRNLERKAAELARINRELDDFTYVASHDLKEPLRGISSYCEILLEDYADRLDEDGRRRLEALVGLCQRLGRLIDDLLAYSRIGRTSADFRPVDLEQIVADVLETLGPAIDDRGGVVRIASSLPRAQADPTMVGEVFRNLISNGLKFNENETPTVEIGAVADESGAVYVRDNGIGIPEQHHGAIFTMFRRLHSRKKYDGTGAGLTFVRKIVEAHGGRVWLQSAPGQGSTFYFTLSSDAGVRGEREELAACAVG